MFNPNDLLVYTWNPNGNAKRKERPAKFVELRGKASAVIMLLDEKDLDGLPLEKTVRLNSIRLDE